MTTLSSLVNFALKFAISNNHKDLRAEKRSNFGYGHPFDEKPH